MLPRQFTDPIVLILLFAVLVAVVAGDLADGQLVGAVGGEPAGRLRVVEATAGRTEAMLQGCWHERLRAVALSRVP